MSTMKDFVEIEMKVNDFETAREELLDNFADGVINADQLKDALEDAKKDIGLTDKDISEYQFREHVKDRRKLEKSMKDLGKLDKGIDEEMSELDDELGLNKSKPLGRFNRFFLKNAIPLALAWFTGFSIYFATRIEYVVELVEQFTK